MNSLIKFSERSQMMRQQQIYLRKMLKQQSSES